MTGKANKHIISATGKIRISIWILWVVFLQAISIYTFHQALRALKQIKRRKEIIQGIAGIPKFFRLGKRYYYELHTPGFPSPSFNNFIKTELRKNIQGIPENGRIQNVVLSISGKCPLKCEHCFEWDRLSDDETMSFKELSIISRTVQDAGATIIQISGGEPLERFPEACRLAAERSDKTDFWLLTSGYGLDHMKALLLKHSGYTGINIGLDHWDPEKHNAFRGDKHAFRWVVEAAKNIDQNGMALALSLCATKAFVSRENLEKYLELATSLNAIFIQILEPRSTGKYKGMDVALSPEQRKVLSTFYMDVNNKKKYSSSPAITYHGNFQRSHGCLGATSRFMYIDTHGNAHACPFCQDPAGNVLEEGIHAILRKTREKGCQLYREYRGP